MGIFDPSLPLLFFEPKRQDGLVFMRLILQHSLVCVSEGHLLLSQFFILCKEREQLSFVLRVIVLLSNA